MDRLKTSLKRDVDDDQTDTPGEKINAKANGDENIEENFVKSNMYFKEIVKDTKNLAAATDAIQKELKQHKMALDEFKQKTAATTKKYNTEMDKVKQGFGKVKDASGELANADGDMKDHD